MTDARVNLNDSISTITSGLLMRASSRDEQAWERLVHLYSPLVYKWCRQKRLSPDEAENIGQEVFLAVDRQLKHFEHDGVGSTFRGWLRRITQNKIIDFFRRSEKQPKTDRGSLSQRQIQSIADDGANELDSQFTSEETKLLYHRMVDWIRTEFEETTWLAFYQVVVDDKRPADVAVDLNITTNAVYLAKSRILRRVREYFSEQLGTDLLP